MNLDKCMAMLLAGGEGKRLRPLTVNQAKPAVSFGGQYRLVDFPLSNCLNAGITQIGILTQYRADSLHQHIGKQDYHLSEGQKPASIALLQSGEQKQAAYTGTADAVYKNISYIDSLQPEHVLILSADHIYQMDYRELLRFHIDHDAAATISVTRVPWEETSRFGIMNTDEDYRIQSFQEKPSQAKSNLASMGIYAFRWPVLREILIEDAANPASSHDFGNDIIPRLLKKGDHLFAFPFEGYWKDVGTAESLWRSHMDLLGCPPLLALNPVSWPMRVGGSLLPQNEMLRMEDERGSCSLLHQRCYTEGRARRSVLSYGVWIGKDSLVTDSIIMPNAIIGKNVLISHAIIGEGAIIEDGAVIGGARNQISVIGAMPRVGLRPHWNVYGSRRREGGAGYERASFGN
ncbi:MAG: glgC [Paenibacillaceae bacterium]|jgi:glucose-1-phosphate adenylyltransferase|nr:glgC [Paenibacillaceae bacterium]